MQQVNLLSDIQFDYVNYKGIKGKRDVKVWNIYFGSTDFHTESQWLMKAWDYDKQDIRIFAMKDMSNVVVISD